MSRINLEEVFFVIVVLLFYHIQIIFTDYSYFCRSSKDLDIIINKKSERVLLVTLAQVRLQIKVFSTTNFLVQQCTLFFLIFFPFYFVLCFDIKLSIDVHLFFGSMQDVIDLEENFIEYWGEYMRNGIKTIRDPMRNNLSGVECKAKSTCDFEVMDC